MKAALSILIVEDNQGDLLLLKEYLGLTGVAIGQLWEAASMEAASHLLAGSSPDLILLDLFLPDSNGLDTFDRIHHQCPATPIIVLSGLPDAGVALKTIQKGAQEYLVKGDYDERLLSKIIQYSIERNSITQKLKTSIDRYDLVAKATSDVVWDWDINSDGNWFNDNFELLFGHKLHKLTPTLDAWYQHIHPDDRERIVADVRKAIAEGRPHWEGEYRFRRADGSYAVIFDRGYTLYSPEGKPYRMIGSMQDITKERELQERLIKDQLQSQRKITEVTIRSQEQEREEIGKELHDNINQILAACKIMVETSLRNEDMREMLLPKACTHLNTAIEEIRKLSRNLVPPTLDKGLEEAVYALADSVQTYSLLQFHLAIKEDILAGLDKQVQLMLYRVVQEQINNIVKYARATAVDIIIEGKEEKLVLTITDNGIGFDPDEKKSGIGLRNIKSRAALYGGELTIDTAPGTGCRMQVTIPLQAGGFPDEGAAVLL